MRRSWLCVLAIVALAACDGSSQPVSPSPAVPSPPAPPAPPPPYALSGLVRAGGEPAADATVTLLTFETGALIASTTTARNGVYRLSDVQNVSPVSGALVRFDSTVLRPDGTIGIYKTSASPLRLSLPVAPGFTYQIDGVHINPATREFELSTVRR